jgi:hypothetical protein
MVCRMRGGIFHEYVESSCVRMYLKVCGGIRTLQYALYMQVHDEFSTSERTATYNRYLRYIPRRYQQYLTE